MLVAGPVSAHLERKMSEPLVLDSLKASCARMGAAAVEVRAGYREVEPHLMSWGCALEPVGDWFVAPVLYRGIDYQVTCRATIMEKRIRVDLAGIDPLPLAGPWGLPAVPGLQPAE